MGRKKESRVPDEPDEWEPDGWEPDGWEPDGQAPKWTIKAHWNKDGKEGKLSEIEVIASELSMLIIDDKPREVWVFDTPGDHHAARLLLAAEAAKKAYWSPVPAETGGAPSRRAEEEQSGYLTYRRMHDGLFPAKKLSIESIAGIFRGTIRDPKWKTMKLDFEHPGAYEALLIRVAHAALNAYYAPLPAETSSGE